MTPRVELFALHKDRTAADVVKSLLPIRYSRIPIFDQTTDQIIGVVLRHQLAEACLMGNGNATLDSLKSPVHFVPESKSIASVLDEFIRRHEHLFVVVNEYGGTEGVISLDGEPQNFRSPAHALSAGVGMLYQDPHDFPPFRVIDNYLLGREAGVSLNFRTARRELEELARRYGFEIDVNAYIDSLSLGERQQLELPVSSEEAERSGHRLLLQEAAHELHARIRVPDHPADVLLHDAPLAIDVGKPDGHLVAQLHVVLDAGDVVVVDADADPDIKLLGGMDAIEPYMARVWAGQAPTGCLWMRRRRCCSSIRSAIGTGR